MRAAQLVFGVSLLALSAGAMASDGTITFTGKVSAKTCTISTTGGKDFTVNLPTVSKSSLASAGSVAGRTSFQIDLTQCTGGKVATYFEPGATVDSATGRLVNQATPATAAGNVELQLLGSNNQVLPIKSVGATGAQANSQWVTIASDGSASLKYSAEYYAVGASTPGDVSSSVKYTLIYD